MNCCVAMLSALTACAHEDMTVLLACSSNLHKQSFIVRSLFDCIECHCHPAMLFMRLSHTIVKILRVLSFEDLANLA